MTRLGRVFVATGDVLHHHEHTVVALLGLTYVISFIVLMIDWSAFMAGVCACSGLLAASFWLLRA